MSTKYKAYESTIYFLLEIYDKNKKKPHKFSKRLAEIEENAKAIEEDDAMSRQGKSRSSN